MTEIEAAEQEVFEKRWYDDSKRLGDEAGEKRRRELEEKYGVENLGPYSLYERGVLDGKHVALRWVLDTEASLDDPGFLDT